MTRWWISWYEPDTGDVRPNGTWPLPPPIQAWWNSGGSYTHATLCAVVDAETEEEAKSLIAGSWPDHGSWRFCEEKPDGWQPGPRFPWPEEAR